MRRSLAGLTVGALALVVLVTTYLLFQYTSRRSQVAAVTACTPFFTTRWGSTSGRGFCRPACASVRSRSACSTRSRARPRSSSESCRDQALPERRRGQEGGLSAWRVLHRDRSGFAVCYAQQPAVALPELHEGDEIKTVTEPVEMGEIMNSVGETLPILRDILSDVKVLTSGPIKDIANNANQLLERNSAIVERLLGRIDDIAATVQGITRSEAEDVRVTLHNAREITRPSRD